LLNLSSNILVLVKTLIMLMLFLEQPRGRPTWSLRRPGARGHHVGDPCRNVSCLGEHSTQGTSTPELTSKLTTEFAYKGTSRGLHKERYCRLDNLTL